MSLNPRTPTRRRTAAALGLAIALSCLGSVVGTGPLGGAAPASAEPQPVGSPGVSRYFGKGAYQGIRAAVAATPRTCDLPDDTLTALVMAPIFKEVSMAESPESAPSPMTLSRWDEWTGKVSGSTNMNANYGLYAFRDPHGTPYKRAYWNPGVGIFQYDVAGVGAPYTAAEMMNVEFIARDVATGMANRYCAAGGDGFTRRAAAWGPWSGLGGVAKSEALLQEMVAVGRPAFSNIGLVEGIENTGGMQARTCVVAAAGTPCDYVDPALAQGANWWATDDPSGGTVAAGEAPLTAPFYVVKRNGFEERHWMSEDTGYPVDLVARRLLGQNARPMDGQPQSGLQWAEGTDLCDTARPEMGCEPKPKPKPKAPAVRRAPAVKRDEPVPQAEGSADRTPSGAKAGKSEKRPRSLVGRFGVVESLDLAGTRHWDSLRG
jgi:hypothetical protein